LAARRGEAYDAVDEHRHGELDRNLDRRHPSAVPGRRGGERHRTRGRTISIALASAYP